MKCLECGDRLSPEMVGLCHHCFDKLFKTAESDQELFVDQMSEILRRKATDTISGDR